MLKKIIDSGGFNALVQARHGYVLYNKNDIYIGKCIEKYGEFSEQECEIFDQLCEEGDVVVEVGANIGAHTMAIAKKLGKSGRIYAFEPQRMVFQMLCANMAINSIANAECYQMGVGARAGYVLIPDISSEHAMNFGGIEIDKFKKGHKVPVIKLDEFLTLTRLKLLKIDVEGMEAQVLKGAEKTIRTFGPVIYTENDRREKSKELIELIWALDYEAYWHLPYMYRPANFAGDRENLFPGIVSFNMLCLPKASRVNISGFRKVENANEYPFMENL